jgi:RNA methyltransferase, TrmH family
MTSPKALESAAVITSRDNPLIKTLRKLCEDGAAYRKTGQIWIEGEHLCQAYWQAGLRPDLVVVSESKWPIALVNTAWAAIKTVVVADSLMPSISTLEHAAGMGFLCDLPALAHTITPGVNTVVLDRLQDPGNAGSILRSSAAFGFTQVVALKGSVALWSPKVLRAGMGAHFGLRLVELAALDDLDQLGIPIAVTSSHEGRHLHALQASGGLQQPMAWVMGHEGQGASPELMARATLKVSIAQPGGQESLNVAAAAAICLHASAVSAGA